MTPLIQSKGNLNQIGSLRRNMTIILAMVMLGWARHARLCRACRDVTWQAKWNLDLMLA